MPRRLFDGLDDGLDEEILLLDNLTPPGASGARCSLYWALARALQLSGENASYARLMGLGGAAFMLPLGPDLTVDWAAADVERHLPEVFETLDSWAAHEEQPWEPVLLSLCQEELRAQRALAGQEADGGWLAIVGLKGRELLVQRPDSRQPYERLAPQLEALISLGEPVAPPAGPPSELRVLADGLEALWRAMELLRESQEHWEAWGRGLGTDEPYGPEREQLARFMNEQQLIATVIEARECAALFLEELASQTDFEFAEALDAAAGAAWNVTTALEQLVASPEVIQVAHGPEDDAWVERHRDALAGVSQGDDRLLVAIHDALDYAGDVD